MCIFFLNYLDFELFSINFGRIRFFPSWHVMWIWKYILYKCHVNLKGQPIHTNIGTHPTHTHLDRLTFSVEIIMIILLRHNEFNVHTSIFYFSYFTIVPYILVGPYYAYTSHKRRVFGFPEMDLCLCGNCVTSIVNAHFLPLTCIYMSSLTWHALLNLHI